MSDQESRQAVLENLWVQEGVWRRSTFVRDFLKRARAQYPIPQNGSKAAWPEDRGRHCAEPFLLLYGPPA